MLEDCDFNQPIDNLPQTLKKLRISGEFNQSIDNLPQTLKRIELYGEFNKDLDKLPKNLEYLIALVDFRGKLDRLPKSVKTVGLFDCVNLQDLEIREDIEIVRENDISGHGDYYD